MTWKKASGAMGLTSLGRGLRGWTMWLASAGRVEVELEAGVGRPLSGGGEG